MKLWVYAMPVVVFAVTWFALQIVVGVLLFPAPSSNAVLGVAFATAPVAFGFAFFWARFSARKASTGGESARETVAVAGPKSSSSYFSTLISYGRPDEQFARTLRSELEGRGVDTYFYPVDANVGRQHHHEIWSAIESVDRVLLVCSRNSLDRRGVLDELNKVLAREAREGVDDILIPLRIDDYVLDEWTPTRPHLREAVHSRVIADFTKAPPDSANWSATVDRVMRALDRDPNAK